MYLTINLLVTAGNHNIPSGKGVCEFEIPFSVLPDINTVHIGESGIVQ